MRLLFVCGRNRRRSPTAEEVFGNLPGFEACSAGLNPDADNPITSDLIEWSEVIFVMEPKQRAKLSRMFSRGVKGKRVVCLEISDKYDYMDPTLVRLLWERVPRSVPGLTSAKPT